MGSAAFIFSALCLLPSCLSSDNSPNPQNDSSVGSSGSAPPALPTPKPTITNISPDRGTTNGGSVVSVLGAGFQTGLSLKIGNADCGSVNVVSPNELTCSTPIGNSGTDDVVATNPGGNSGTLPKAFTYLQGDSWTPMSAGSNVPGLIAGGGYWTAVWSGTEMILWRGGGARVGARYYPATDTWKPISMINAPSSRDNYSSTWNGTRMFVWGGIDPRPQAAGVPMLNTGASYDPATDTWATMTTLMAPAARAGHTAVTIGSKIVVWGGQGNNGFVSSGGIYDPATDTWVATSLTKAPSVRSFYNAVSTGIKMVVWGGERISDGISVNTGGIYDPATNTWAPISTVGAPAARVRQLQSFPVWTGTQMLIWGGFINFSGAPDFLQLKSGGLFDPSMNAWKPISTTNAPLAVEQQTVWAGNQMLLWAPGAGNSGSFDPVTNTWKSISHLGSPAQYGIAVWTGVEMIVWGGATNSGRYVP